MDQSGGVTAHTRAPATGLWKEDSAHVVKDEVVIYEVLTEELDRSWWQRYREKLEQRFEQESHMIYSTGIDRL